MVGVFVEDGQKLPVQVAGTGAKPHEDAVVRHADGPAPFPCAELGGENVRAREDGPIALASILGDLDDVGRRDRRLAWRPLAAVAEFRPADPKRGLFLVAGRSRSRLLALDGLDVFRSMHHLDQQNVPVAVVAVAVQPVTDDDGRGIIKRRGQALTDHLIIGGPDLRLLLGLHGFEIAPLGGNQPVDVGHRVNA